MQVSKSQTEVALNIGAAVVALLYISVASSYGNQIVVWICVSTILAASLRFVLLIGEVNLATGAFAGIGAYAAAIATTTFEVPVWSALLFGGVLAGVASIPFGLLTLRVKGPYFLLVSFCCTEVLRLLYTKSAFLGGNSGIVGINPGISHFSSLVVVLTAAALIVLVIMEGGALGRYFVAIRCHEPLARALGIRVLWVKVVCLVIASTAAGFGGAILAHANAVIAPGDFGFLLSVFALTYVKIGGEGSIVGSIVGATLMTIAEQQLLSFGTQQSLLVGTVLVFGMLILPKGLVGAFQHTAEVISRRRKASEDAASVSKTI